MSNAFRVWNNWFSVSSQTAMLALEAQSVIALRLMRIAGGGAFGPIRSDSDGDGKGAGPWGSSSGCGGWVGDRPQ